MLLQEQGNDWDIEWDYTMGMPEDNGFDVTFIGDTNAITYEMTDKGLYMRVGGADAYACIQPPIKTCTKGIVEVSFRIQNFSTSGSGFRILLSNGLYGCQIFIIYVNQGTTGISYDISTGNANKLLEFVKSLQSSYDYYKDYTIRLEFDEKTGNKIYLDGVLLKEYRDFSHYYCIGNKIFQQSSGETYLKSIKYKFG